MSVECYSEQTVVEPQPRLCALKE